MTRHMAAMATAWVLACGIGLPAQEREVPSDSVRISIPGCSKDRAFVVTEGPEDQPVRSDVAPGRRFRLNGPRKILDDIHARETSLIEVTGLVRKGQLNGPGGVEMAGGRVRIGGGSPQSAINSASRDPMFNVVVMDVESYRVLPGACNLK